MHSFVFRFRGSLRALYLPLPAPELAVELPASAEQPVEPVESTARGLLQPFSAPRPPLR